MKRTTLFSLGFLLLVTLIFYRPVFIGKIPVPTDTLVNLFHPYRDYFSSTNPRGVPYKNPLVGDPVTQIIPWKMLSLTEIASGNLPLWNPYQMAGYPLLGNIQSSPFYPLNILLGLLPFLAGWTIFIMLQQILASLWMYLYLKNRKLSELPSVLGALAFSFSGFFISWLEWGTILHTALWLPLSLLAVDKLVASGRRKWNVVLIICFVSSFLAGHSQTFIYTQAILVAYIVYSFLVLKKDWKLFLSSVISLIIGSLIILPVAIPQIQLILLSARNIDQSYHQPGWFIPLSQAIQFIAPDFFGNPATGNYWGVFNYGEFIGYVGIFPLLLVFYAIGNWRKEYNLFWIATSIVSLLFAFETPIAKIPYHFAIPFLSSTQPTRLLIVTDIALAILAAYGLEYFLKSKRKVFFPQIILLIFFGISVFYGVNAVQQKIITGENWLVARHNLIVPAALVVVSCCGLFILSCMKQRYRSIGSGLFILLTALDLLFFAGKYTPFSLTKYFYPTTKAIAFLKNQPGEFRIMTTTREILHPNINTYYHLQSINGYDPLYLLRYGELLAASGRRKPDISAPFGYFRILTPENFDTPIINLLGVKYILSLNELSDPPYVKVFSEGETRIYRNDAAFPRTFFVGAIKNVPTTQNAIEALFDPKVDLRRVAVVESSPDLTKMIIGIGSTTILSYTENKIIIKTNNISDGFLVLTDTYYPSWSASVDGIETSIIRTDFNFRGIVVPKGVHTVEFKDTLL